MLGQEPWESSYVRSTTHDALAAALGWLRPLLTVPKHAHFPVRRLGFRGCWSVWGGLMLRVGNLRAGFVPASVTPAPDPGGPIR